MGLVRLGRAMWRGVGLWRMIRGFEGVGYGLGLFVRLLFLISYKGCFLG